jgi:branched-chain amino acid transport system permease protein
MKIFLARPAVRIAVAAAIVVLLVAAPLVSTPYLNYQFSMVAVFAVALLGLNVVMGYAGQVSLGQSAFLGLGAYIAAYGVSHHWPIPVVFVLCCVIPAAVGMLVALAAARLRGLALAMVTISLPIIGVPLAKRFPEFTGGSQGSTVSWLNAPGWSGLADDQWRYYVVVIIATLLFVLGRNLVRGRIGRAFAIVKSNEAVALSMGISPYRYKVLAFTIASLFGGAAGFLYIAIVQYTSPETLSFATSINLVAAMVIGGSASILGTILGAVYFVVVPVVAGQVDSTRTALISGAVLLAVLFVLPQGLVSLPRRIVQLASGSRRRAGRSTVNDPPGGTTAPSTTAPSTTAEPEPHKQSQ